MASHDMDEYKQVILIRQDLKMSKGKIAAQAAHAAVEAVFNSSRKNINEWKKQGMKKIALKVTSEKEMMTYLRKAKDEGFDVGLITDAGHTEVAPQTKTALAIGPDKEEKIDRLTKDLTPL